MGILVKYKFLLINVIVCFLVISFITLITTVIHRKNILVLENEGIDKLEYIREKTLELSSLKEVYRDKHEIENSDLVILIEDLSNDFLSSDNSHKYFAGSPDMVVVGSAIYTNWISFKNSYIDFNATGDVSEFIKSGESYYSNLNATINNAEKYVSVYERRTKMLLICSVINISVGVMLVWLEIRLIALSKLKKDEKLKAEESDIDNADDTEEKPSYGVINLDELGFEEVDLSKDRDIAVVIFYIDNLREAEETIKNSKIALFAEKIDVAKEVLCGEVVIKKYSEFEFVVYTKNTNEKNVGEYLKKVVELVEILNEEDDKFNINFIGGCSLTTELTESTTVKELVEVAIKDMIDNMKMSKEDEITT